MHASPATGTTGELSLDERLVRPPVTPGPGSGRLVILDSPVGVELNVAEQLAFVGQYLTRHVGTDEKALQPFRIIRQRVMDRQAETRLFLGVVGEFSSGKSTLVNALIRERLLRTDVLQGTTAAATLLRYGERFDVQVRRRRGNLAQRTWSSITRGATAIKGIFGSEPPPSRDDLSQLLYRATSEEEFARDVVQVDVTLPSPTLLDGLVVVDTPGANAENPRHSSVTAAALRDLCDAALVVVPAEAAGAESLFDFLQKYAADVVHRCVFVVTKIDLLRREKDRERVLENLRARVSRQFNVANPRVLACAPQLVLEGLDRSGDGEFTEEEIRLWTERFAAMESKLEEALREKRFYAQVDDVAKLTVQLISHLQELLRERSEGYRQRHDAIEAAVLPDVDRFVSDRIDTRRSSCKQALAKIARRAEGELESAAASIVAEIARAVNGADSRNALRAAVDTKIPAAYASGQRRLQAVITDTLKRASKAAGWELGVFHEEFQQHFRALATLGGKLKGDGFDARALSQLSSARGEAANREFARELRGLDNGQIAATMGMAAGGAAIGTLLFPGPGTVVGLVIGGALSRLFGPSLAELKSKCWAQLEPEVRGGLDAFCGEAKRAIEASNKATLKQLCTSIEAYLPRYNDLVRMMRKQDEEEKRQLMDFRRVIENDLSVIQVRRETVEGLRRRLRDL